MREMFESYYNYTDAQYEQIWQDATIVFDTNVLLNLYEYSETTRAQLIDLIIELNRSSRLWLPNRVAREFHQLRFKTIENQITRYNKNPCMTQLNILRQELDKKTGHPHVGKEAREELEAVCHKLEEDFNKNHEWLNSLRRDDMVLNTITDVYDGKVGKPYSADDLKKIYQDGKLRYSCKIPPGWKDNTEELEETRYGDLVLWKQVLDYAKEHDIDIILVTADEKEDWWEIRNEKTIRAQPALREEMSSHAGRKILIYTPDRFTKYAKEKLGMSFDESALQEVRSVQKSAKEDKQEDSHECLDPVMLEEKVFQHMNIMADLKHSIRDIDEKREYVQNELEHVHKLMLEADPENEQVHVDHIIRYNKILVSKHELEEQRRILERGYDQALANYNAQKKLLRGL